MHVTLVYVQVKKDYVDDFIAATRANHEASIGEETNCRFDVLQSPDDPCAFVLYEAYENAAGAVAHKQSEHYLTWRETVADWMAEPRRGVSYNGLIP